MSEQSHGRFTIFDKDILLRAFGSAGTLEGFPNCIRCTSAHERVLNSHGWTDCKDDCMLCNGHGHKGYPCPLMRTHYAEVFTEDWLMLHCGRRTLPTKGEVPVQQQEQQGRGSRGRGSRRRRNDRGHSPFKKPPPTAPQADRERAAQPQEQGPQNPNPTTWQYNSYSQYPHGSGYSSGGGFGSQSGFGGYGPHMYGQSGFRWYGPQPGFGGYGPQSGFGGYGPASGLGGFAPPSGPHGSGSLSGLAGLGAPSGPKVEDDAHSVVSNRSHRPTRSHGSNRGGISKKRNRIRQPAPFNPMRKLLQDMHKEGRKSKRADHKDDNFPMPDIKEEEEETEWPCSAAQGAPGANIGGQGVKVEVNDMEDLLDEVDEDDQNKILAKHGV